ncbi:MAG TPA: DUF2142 domain-containing protein [Lactovum miscens]
MTRNVLLLVILFGSVACFIKPIQRGIDEETHLSNVIQLADGNFLARQVTTPYLTGKFNPNHPNTDQPDWTSINNFDTYRNPNSKSVTNFSSSFFNEKHRPSHYTGIVVGLPNPSYIPNAIAWDFGRLFSDRVFVSYYLGRLANVLMYAFLVLIAFKVSRHYKEVLYIFATFPTTLWIVSGYSYDYLYYGLSLILLAMLTNFLAEKGTVGKVQILQFVGTSLLMIFPKFPFVLIGTLILFLPKSYYVHARDRIFAFFLLAGVGILSFIYLLTGSMTSQFHSGTQYKGPGILHVLLHPLPLVRTLFSSAVGSLGSFIGIQIGSQTPIQYINYGSPFISATMPLLFMILFFVIILRIKFEVPKVINYSFVVLFLIMSFTTMYGILKDPRVGFTTASLSVGGISSRYFYLFFLAVPLILSKPLKSIVSLSKDFYEKDSKFNLFLQYSMSFLNIVVLGIAMFGFRG